MESRKAGGQMTHVCTYPDCVENDDKVCPSWLRDECDPTKGSVPTPCHVSPEVEAALLFVLWHHQGSSSPVGQPIRRILGIGEYAQLTQTQLIKAKEVRGKLGL